jgi:hypothetical protein
MNQESKKSIIISKKQAPRVFPIAVQNDDAYSKARINKQLNSPSAEATSTTFG